MVSAKLFGKLARIAILGDSGTCRSMVNTVIRSFNRCVLAGRSSPSLTLTRSLVKVTTCFSLLWDSLATNSLLGLTFTCSVHLARSHGGCSSVFDFEAGNFHIVQHCTSKWSRDESFFLVKVIRCKNLGQWQESPRSMVYQITKPLKMGEPIFWRRSTKRR